MKNQTRRGENEGLTSRSQLMRTFFIFSFLALALTSCSPFSKLQVRYVCPSFSGVVLDDYTGKPVEGAKVNVSWSALRHKWPEGSDSMDLHAATAVTDKNGIYTIPAWESEAASEWRYYEFNPIISVSDPRTKPDPQMEKFQRDVAWIESTGPHYSPTSNHFAYKTVKVELPDWAISQEEVSEREKGNMFPDVADEVLSNSLSYYVVHKNIVENGRYINSTDFLTTGYIRPKPDVLITNIKSFSINLPNDVLNKDWPRPNFHFANTDKQEPYSAFSITLFTKDAQKVARLEWANNGGNDLLFMLGNKPLAANYLSTGKFDKIPIPTNSQTIYLPLREHQDIHEIEQALQKLVQEK
jgi:hypothetical protein